MGVKYFCDVCQVTLVPAGSTEYGAVEGSGVRSTDASKGWERCGLREGSAHFCVVCGFGIADAFKREARPC